MELLEIKRYKDIDGSFKEVVKPVKFNYIAHRAAINYDYEKQLQSYNEATPYYVAVTCAEYIKSSRGVVKDDDGLLWQFADIDKYVDFISQEPTNESCKGLVLIPKYIDASITNIKSFLEQNKYKTLEHFIMDGGTILIPLEK